MATLEKAPTSNFWSTSLNGAINDSVTTITLNSTVGLQAPGRLVINRQDSTGKNTPSAREVISFTGISGSDLTGVTRGADNSTARSHADGSLVESAIVVGNWDALYKVVNQEHSTSGVHSVADMITGGSVIDDDTFATASATTLATSESTKAYVDNGTWLKDSIFRQAILNGNFDVDQRVGPYTASRNNDDVYILDRWNLISDGNDVFDVSQEAITDLPGSNYAIKLDVETAKRGGIVQFLEAKDAQKFKGKTVSISFAVKSANISALRATVLSWASTADAITSDVVGTWGATPTWAAGWADNATPADLTVTSSWTTVKVEGIVLDEATVNNLALVIWTPNEETIGDIVYITQVQMNEGSKALPFMPKSFEEELRACMRYYEKSYEYAIPTATASESGMIESTGAGGACTVGDYVIVKHRYQVPKRLAVTPTVWDQAGNSGKCSLRRAESFLTNNITANVDQVQTNSFRVYAVTTATNQRGLIFHFASDAEL